MQNIKAMISPIVIQIKKPSGLLITYIKKESSFYSKTLRERQHKCRIKEMIYGGVYSYYAEGMNFTKSIEAGGEITIDNREKFGFTVLGS